MEFKGKTHCPQCTEPTNHTLRSVLRKAEDYDVKFFQCENCGVDLVVHVEIVHHVTINLDKGL